MSDPRAFAIKVEAAHSGQRVDAVVASQLADCSRSQAAALIQSGAIQVEGRVRKPGYRLKPGETIRGEIPAPEIRRLDPEPIALDIRYEDACLLAINKPPGQVVHPAAGHFRGTLVHGLLHYWPPIAGVGEPERPGIVHRLDKDTSGILVVAKTPAAHARLCAQFKSRSVQKTYQALVWGEPQADAGVLTQPIGRDPVHRKRMSVRSLTGRPAETHWRVVQRFGSASLLHLTIKTGRTHQIRVHCAALGHPVLGDTVYGGRRIRKSPPLPRQMLHAWQLGISHPESGLPLRLEAPVPTDMAAAISRLSRNAPLDTAF